MPKKPFTLAISAEAIPILGCGLGYFLTHAIASIRAARPEWRLYVVARRSFPELLSRADKAVTCIVPEHAPLRRYAEQLLRRRFSADHAARAGKYVPTQTIKRLWGDFAAAWATLPEVNAAWVPHFSIDNESLSQFRNMKSVTSP